MIKLYYGYDFFIIRYVRMTSTRQPVKKCCQDTYTHKHSLFLYLSLPLSLCSPVSLCHFHSPVKASNHVVHKLCLMQFNVTDVTKGGYSYICRVRQSNLMSGRRQGVRWLWQCCCRSPLKTFPERSKKKQPNISQKQPKKSISSQKSIQSKKQF